jgi:hypothetical protein
MFVVVICLSLIYTKQMAQQRILLILVFFTIINNCCVYGRALTYSEQQVQLCINQDVTRQPIIIDTDTDVDDLWAIHYLLNVSINVKKNYILSVFVIIDVKGTNC